MRNNLLIARKNAGYIQKDVAEYLDITERQYRRLENDIPKSVRQFEKLAKLYDTTIDNLINGKESGCPDICGIETANGTHV